MIRRLILAAAGLALVGLIVAGGLAAWLHAGYTRPGPSPSDTTVIIPRGAGIAGIAARLKSAGLIADERIFRLGVRLWDGDEPLKAGEFAIPARASAREVVRILREGKTVVRRVTFAEGLTTREMLDQLRAVEGLEGDVPDGVAEGALLPETYHFSYGDTRAEIVARMRRAMDETLAELWPERDRTVPLRSPEQAVILASIVEKETGVPEERPRVAGVFVNRLDKGMRLQSDPTVVYGLTEGAGALGRPLTRDDLKKPTPYNTYVIGGLPPTPIANPGRASLAAVLHPAETDELYFVADGTGGHVFSKTLREHNRNVAKWRRIQRQKKE